ncbi:unnamed protein product, partial [Diatraea saccharalis]
MYIVMIYFGTCSGSCHRVRVTSYNPCDFLYTVSDRADVLAERYFTLAAISVGQIVDATVRQVTDSHLLVDVGRTNGYIPKTHFSDAGIFVDPKKASHSKLTKKFKPGQTLRARVLVVDKAKNSLLLTLKPTLLAEDLEILSSYEQAQVGKGYTGFIRVVRDYIVVSFFNNVSAYVPRHYVTKEPLESLQDAFHLGQIVNCTILRVDAENKKMGGSLTTVPFWPAIKREKIRKRKSNSDDSDELPNKKRKQSDRDEKSNERVKKEDTYEENNDVDDKKKTKKDKKKKESHIDEELTSEQITKKSIKSKEIIEEDDEKTNKKEKKTNKKKKKGDSDEMNKVSEESDAIETDIHEDSDQVLTPEDLFLIDLSDCNDIHKCKKRIVSLTKNINARMRRIERIDEKIQKIENVGLNAKNKKFHTAMHMEKLVIEERIKKLLEGLKNAQEKLNDLGYDGEDDRTKRKNRKGSTSDDITEDKPDHIETKATKEMKSRLKNNDRKESVAVKDVKESEKKKIKVVESLEPVLEIPSAKDFWAGMENLLPNKVQEDESSSSDEEVSFHSLACIIRIKSSLQYDKYRFLYLNVTLR